MGVNHHFFILSLLCSEMGTVCLLSASPGVESASVSDMGPTMLSVSRIQALSVKESLEPEPEKKREDQQQRTNGGERTSDKSQ